MSLLKRLNGQQDGHTAVSASHAGISTLIRKSSDSEMEMQLHNYVLEELKKHPNVEKTNRDLIIREMAEPFIDTVGERLSFEEKNSLFQSVYDDLAGYGPITPFLNEPEITEVMVNGFQQIYVEKNGQLIKTNAAFRNDEHVLQVIEKIISPLGRRLDESTPMVDARLPDGSRVNAIIPPLALNGPTITIRKFSKKPFQIADLIRFGTLSKEMGRFVDYCIKSGLNIFISGGTGSGKTTSLNVFSSFIPDNERIVTIEDAAELKLHQEHVVSLETRPPNIEGKGEIAIRDLVRNSLRMRPDRIIVGEVRGAEALDMLQAMNTGHDGSMGTGHANSPRDMLARLETMVLMAGVELPVRAIREQIAGAIDLIIHQSRLKDGSRKIMHITEVIGMEGDKIVLQDVFVFRQTGIDAEGKFLGSFASTGIRPHCAEKLGYFGFHLPAEWFLGEWQA